MQFKCDCQTVKCIKTNLNDILNRFENIRKNCPALREIFIPEDYWPEFSKKASEALDEAGHYPITLSAFKSGNLGNITQQQSSYANFEEIVISLLSCLI